MKHEPRGTIRNLLAVKRLRHPMELERAHALLAGAHEMNRKEPLVERDVRILEDAAHGNGEFVPASTALVQTLARSLTRQLVGVVDFAAMRAHRTFRPALFFKELPRLLFIGKKLKVGLGNLVFHA